MKKLMARKPNGFTLIEFVIVIALASLLMLTVLNATGGAKRSQRDAQRKSDFGRMRSQLEQYASNHGGIYPNDTLGFRSNGATDTPDFFGATVEADREFIAGWVDSYARDILTPDEFVEGTENHARYTYYSLGRTAPNAVTGSNAVATASSNWTAGTPQTAAHMGANRVFYIRCSWNADRVSAAGTPDPGLACEPGRYSVWMIMEGGISGFTQDSRAIDRAGRPQ